MPRRIELRNAVPGAAKLERAGPLQAFGLEQHAPTAAGIEHRRFKNGSRDGKAGQPPGGHLDIGKIGQHNDLHEA